MWVEEGVIDILKKERRTEYNIMTVILNLCNNIVMQVLSRSITSILQVRW